MSWIPYGNQRTARPARDESYCDLGFHTLCPGFTEDESDPESCFCTCHGE